MLVPQEGFARLLEIPSKHLPITQRRLFEPGPGCTFEGAQERCILGCRNGLLNVRLVRVSHPFLKPKIRHRRQTHATDQRVPCARDDRNTHIGRKTSRRAPIERVGVEDDVNLVVRVEVIDTSLCVQHVDASHVEAMIRHALNHGSLGIRVFEIDGTNGQSTAWYRIEDANPPPHHFCADLGDVAHAGKRDKAITLRRGLVGQSAIARSHGVIAPERGWQHHRLFSVMVRSIFICDEPIDDLGIDFQQTRGRGVTNTRDLQRCESIVLEQQQPIHRRVTCHLHQDVKLMRPHQLKQLNIVQHEHVMKMIACDLHRLGLRVRCEAVVI